MCNSNYYTTLLWYIAPEKPPSDDYFINYLWIYFIFILISNFCIFITSPVILYFILTWSFFKGGLTTRGWLYIQLCNLSKNTFVMFHPFILLLVFISWYSTHFSFYRISVVFYFLVVLLIYFFDTPNILEADFTALSLTKTNQCGLCVFICLFQVCQPFS